MDSILLNNDNHLINWIKTEIKLQNERNQNKEMEPERTGSTNQKPSKSQTALEGYSDIGDSVIIA